MGLAGTTACHGLFPCQAVHGHPFPPLAAAPALLSCLCVFCGSWLVPWDSRGLMLGSPAISPADFFQGKHFFLYGEFPGDERRTLSRYVTAFNGSVSGDRGGRGGGVVGRGE